MESGWSIEPSAIASGFNTPTFLHNMLSSITKAHKHRSIYSKTILDCAGVVTVSVGVCIPQSPVPHVEEAAGDVRRL